jgi:hypothetical protein
MGGGAALGLGRDDRRRDGSPASKAAMRRRKKTMRSGAPGCVIDFGP